MKTTFKRVILTFLSAATILSSSPALGNKIQVNMPENIYTSVEERMLSSGISHESIQRFTASGWYNINVVRVDLNNPYASIQGLFNQEGLPKRDSVSGMVKKSGAIAGVNGDFFNTRPLSSPMSTMINNGEMISAPIEKAYALPAVFIDSSNSAKVGYIDRNMNVVNHNSGKKVIINTINRLPANFTSVTLLNKYWGGESIGNRFNKDLIEVVVSGDTVKDVRIGQKPTAIPKDGYVLAVRGDNTQALESFKPGDKVDLNVYTTPSMNEIKFAMGGGSIILKDGALSNTNIDIKGNHPRTGIGVSEDSKEMILVTIDGRHSTYRGVSQEMFGQIMKELGSHNAINLDGGGSTAMAVKSEDKKVEVVNTPSDGGERRVINGVGVFSNAPIGELSYLKLDIDNKNVFINTSRNISVKAYDENHNNIEIDKSKLSYEIEGVESEIKGTSFKALSSGKAKILAKHGEIVGSLDITVLGPVEDLILSKDHLRLDVNSETSLPQFTGKDENGYEAPISLGDIDLSLSGDIGRIEGAKFFSADKTSTGILTAKLGNASKNIKISVGSKAELVSDFESIEGFSFSSYPADVSGSLALSDNPKEGKHSIALNYDLTKGQGNRAAYLNFPNKGFVFKGEPLKIGIWVKGDKSGTWLRAQLADAKGKTHYLDFTKNLNFDDWKFLEAKLGDNVSYPVRLERIYPVETEPGKKYSGTILLDALTGFYSPDATNVNPPKATVFKDKLNTGDELREGGYRFSVTSDHVGLNQLMGYDVETSIKDKINKNKINIFLNGMTDASRNGLDNHAILNASGAYSTNKHGDVYFIHANTGKGGLRASNPRQWTSLIYQLENRDENNIILLLTSPVFGSKGFSDSLEADLLHKHLVEAQQKGKNVFVIQGSTTNSSTLKEGIRYIELNTRKAESKDDIYKKYIIEFVVNKDKTSYQINPLFTK